MPVVEVDTDTLRDLTGHDKSDDEFVSDLFALGLEFEGETEEGLYQFEFAPDRLDRLSVEGVARSLRYQYGDDRGVAIPETNDPDWTIEVAPTVPEERPYVTGAIVRGLDFDEAGLESLIQIQEKLHATMGRGRAKGAIGVHDLTMLKGHVPDDTPGTKSISYRGISPDGDRFVPLDADCEMTPGEVLTDHPIGDRYADLVADYDSYPAIYDEIGLFSFPPVINGRRTEVSTSSRDLLIEMTGTDQWTIDKMCTIVCYALSARGATIEDVNVVYVDESVAPQEYGTELVRPDLSIDEKSVQHARIERMLGVEFEPEDVIDLFERSGLNATYSLGDEIVYDVEIPPYRVDVLHPLDLIDDIGRTYGFNNLEPQYPDIGTVGGRHEDARLEEAVRTTLVGLGFEDALNFHLIGSDACFTRMNLPVGDDALGGGKPVEIIEPYSSEYEIVRTWALPSLMLLLQNNTHRSYPQDIAEVGFVAEEDTTENTNVTERRHVAAVLARTDATYEDAKGRLKAICDAFDVELATPAADHPSFIQGRGADVVIDGAWAGIIGELHPEVLVEHDLELPVAAFEFDLRALR